MNVDFTIAQIIGSGTLTLGLWAAATTFLAWRSPRCDVFAPPIFGGAALIAAFASLAIHAMA